MSTFTQPKEYRLAFEFDTDTPLPAGWSSAAWQAIFETVSKTIQEKYGAHVIPGRFGPDFSWMGNPDYLQA